MFKIIEFVDEVPKSDPFGLASLAAELRTKPGVWAKIDHDGVPAWMINNGIVKNTFPELPGYLFDVKISDGELFIRFRG